jgi:hypothetical protein
MQGGTPYGTIECLFLFCDMSVSSVTDIFAPRAGGASLGILKLSCAPRGACSRARRLQVCLSKTHPSHAVAPRSDCPDNNSHSVDVTFASRFECEICATTLLKKHTKAH